MFNVPLKSLKYLQSKIAFLFCLAVSFLSDPGPSPETKSSGLFRFHVVVQFDVKKDKDNNSPFDWDNTAVKRMYATKTERWILILLIGLILKAQNL